MGGFAFADEPTALIGITGVGNALSGLPSAPELRAVAVLVEGTGGDWRLVRKDIPIFHDGDYFTSGMMVIAVPERMPKDEEDVEACRFVATLTVAVMRGFGGTSLVLAADRIHDLRSEKCQHVGECLAKAVIMSTELDNAGLSLADYFSLINHYLMDDADTALKMAAHRRSFYAWEGFEAFESEIVVRGIPSGALDPTKHFASCRQRTVHGRVVSAGRCIEFDTSGKLPSSAMLDGSSEFMGDTWLATALKDALMSLSHSEKEGGEE